MSFPIALRTSLARRRSPSHVFKLGGSNVNFSRKGYRTKQQRIFTTALPIFTLRSPISSKTQFRTLYTGALKEAFERIPPIWLRDNCQCISCVHPETKQRLLDTFEIPKEISIDSTQETENGVHIHWSDGHFSEYSNDLLSACAQTTNTGTIRQGLIDITTWDRSIEQSPPTVQYDAVIESDQGLKEWLNKIREFGFCYVDGTPANPTDTEKLLERIAFIRNTHYGGFYDFTADLASKDTAYTSIALEAHTDNTYFTDPAGLQVFHLLSHTEGEGGASLLVDGFRAAQDLKERYPDEYNILSTVNVHAHASGNEGISIQPYRAYPVLETHPWDGHLVRVRWNSSDRAAIEAPMHEVERWYDAARRWDAMMKSPTYQYWCQLKPGRVLVFDNWRVLHGRSAFTGKRRICGGYINRDDWISKFKMLHWGQETVLGAIVPGDKFAVPEQPVGETQPTTVSRKS